MNNDPFFFVFLLENSDSFRTEASQNHSKIAPEIGDFRAFQMGNQIASSRLLKTLQQDKWLNVSHLFPFRELSLTGRSDRTRTGFLRKGNGKMLNGARFKQRNE